MMQRGTAGVALHLLLVVVATFSLLSGATSSNCNATIFAQATSRCEASAGNLSGRASECRGSLCSINASFSVDGCHGVATTSNMAILQASCGDVVDGCSDDVCNRSVNARVVSVDDPLQSQRHVVDTIFSSVQCETSLVTMARVQTCMQQLPCRTSDNISVCTTGCVAQGLSCFLSFACTHGGYVPYSTLGIASSECVALLPLDWYYCHTFVGVSLDKTAWCSGAVRQLSFSMSDSSFLTRESVYFILGGIAIGVLALFGVTALICIWRQRLWCCKGSAEVHEAAESSESPHLHSSVGALQTGGNDTRRSGGTEAAANGYDVVGESDSVRRSADSRQSVSNSATHYSPTKTWKERKRSQILVAPSAGIDSSIPEWGAQFSHDADDWFDPPTIVDRRTNALHLAQMQWTQEGGWARPPARVLGNSRAQAAVQDAQQAMLFSGDEDEGPHEYTSDATNAEGRASSDDDGMARVKVPVYGGASPRRNTNSGGGAPGGRSQTSLGELEFAFTEQSSSRQHSSQIDDVVPLQPLDFADEALSTDGYNDCATPTSDTDGGNARLVYDQECLQSSSMSASTRDDVVAAGAVMHRKDILSGILSGAFVRGRLLGRGTSGSVYQMNLQPQPQLDRQQPLCAVAMKEIDVQRCSRDELSKIIARYNFLSRLSHRHIADLYIVRYEPSTLSLNVWMEFLGGTLSQFAKQFRSFPDPTTMSPALGSDTLLPIHGALPPSATTPYRAPASSASSPRGSGKSELEAPEGRDCFPERELVRLVPQILSALSYLHRKGVVHRDIKGSNVLLTADGRHAKLIDLDCCHIQPSRNASADRPSSNAWMHAAPPSVAGSPLWMPPEILASKATASPATDIWSLGITIAELLLGGALPWPSFDTTFAAMMYITQGHMPKLQRTDLSVPCIEFLQRCWAPTPEARPTAMELRAHGWLQISRPSSFRRPSREGTATPKSTTNASCQGSDSASMWNEEVAVEGLTLVERQSSLQKRFDEQQIEEEMKRLDDELSRF